MAREIAEYLGDTYMRSVPHTDPIKTKGNFHYSQDKLLADGLFKKNNNKRLKKTKNCTV